MKTTNALIEFFSTVLVPNKKLGTHISGFVTNMRRGTCKEFSKQDREFGISDPKSIRDCGKRYTFISYDIQIGIREFFICSE
jgi:hypothetical protein